MTEHAAVVRERDPERALLRKLLLRTGANPVLAFKMGRPTRERRTHRAALAERVREARGLGFTRSRISYALDTTDENIRVLEHCT